MAVIAPLFPPFTSLSDIFPYKTTWRIQVKIVHTWKWSAPSIGETTEIILADEFGTLIHASIRKKNVPQFHELIVPGEWRVIQHVFLIKATGAYRPTKHYYKMNMMDETSIIESPTISNNIYLDLESYEDILDIEALNENILIDVIGQVVTVSEMETLIVADKALKKLEIELRDTNDNRLCCNLWGKFADTMWDACKNVGNNFVVCILRFAKINTYAGERSVSSAFDISMLYINPTFPEALTFVDNLPLDGLGITMSITIPKQIKKQKKDVYYNTSSKKQCVYFDDGDLGDEEDKSG